MEATASPVVEDGDEARAECLGAEDGRQTLSAAELATLQAKVAKAEAEIEAEAREDCLGRGDGRQMLSTGLGVSAPASSSTSLCPNLAAGTEHGRGAEPSAASAVAGGAISATASTSCQADDVESQVYACNRVLVLATCVGVLECAIDVAITGGPSCAHLGDLLAPLVGFVINSMQPHWRRLHWPAVYWLAQCLFSIVVALVQFRLLPLPIEVLKLVISYVQWQGIERLRGLQRSSQSAARTMYLNMIVLNKDEIVRGRIAEKAGKVVSRLGVVGIAGKIANRYYITDARFSTKLGAIVSAKLQEVTKELGITAVAKVEYQQGNLFVVGMTVQSVDIPAIFESKLGEGLGVVVRDVLACRFVAQYFKDEIEDLFAAASVERMMAEFPEGITKRLRIDGGVEVVVEARASADEAEFVFRALEPTLSSEREPAPAAGESTNASPRPTYRDVPGKANKEDGGDSDDTNGTNGTDCPGKCSGALGMGSRLRSRITSHDLALGAPSLSGVRQHFHDRLAQSQKAAKHLRGAAGGRRWEASTTAAPPPATGGGDDEARCSSDATPAPTASGARSSKEGAPALLSEAVERDGEAEDVGSAGDGDDTAEGGSADASASPSDEGVWPPLTSVEGAATPMLARWMPARGDWTRGMMKVGGVMKARSSADAAPAPAASALVPEASEAEERDGGEDEMAGVVAVLGRADCRRVSESSCVSAEHLPREETAIEVFDYAGLESTTSAECSAVALLAPNESTTPGQQRVGLWTQAKGGLREGVGGLREGVMKVGGVVKVPGLQAFKRNSKREEKPGLQEPLLDP